MRLVPKSSTRKEDAPLPLTSLIDVVFLLLIYFMLSSQTSRESELSSTLRPNQNAGTTTSNLQSQIVYVEQHEGEPAYRIGPRIMRTPEQLEAILERLPKQQGVFIRAADSVPMESVAGALQAAKDAGFNKVSYVPGTK